MPASSVKVGLRILYSHGVFFGVFTTFCLCDFLVSFSSFIVNLSINERLRSIIVAKLSTFAESSSDLLDSSCGFASTVSVSVSLSLSSTAFSTVTSAIISEYLLLCYIFRDR